MTSRFIIIFLFWAQITSASILRMDTVMQPLYLHGSETDPRISFERVPYVTFHSDPEWRFQAISVPFIPPTSGTWRPHDVNLTSLYRITVEGITKEDGKGVLVTIDASKAAQPEGYPFTVQQVIDAVTTCVKIMYPPVPPTEGAFEIIVKRGKSKQAAAR